MSASTEVTESRREELRRECREFHAANPDVWDLFVRISLEKAALGHDHYGSVGVFERIRWETKSGGTAPELKLNNNHRAFYARRFNKMHPHLGGGEFFRLREQVSQFSPATGRGDYQPPTDRSPMI